MGPTLATLRLHSVQAKVLAKQTRIGPAQAGVTLAVAVAVVADISNLVLAFVLRLRGDRAVAIAGQLIWGREVRMIQPELMIGTVKAV